ncbi:MAG TPA: hypothetical protein VFY93_08655 [Planctomycetota bacterium]|nr:hypothetical protein [Planctomycetota bacterium]
MRRIAAVALLALVARADPPGAAGGEESLLARFEEADADARRSLVPRIEELERACRYTDARPVLVDLDGRTLPVPDIFEEILEPALEMPVGADDSEEPGLREVHRRALHALEALREAYAAPRPVRAGTLNLFLGYGARALTARAIPASLRIRLFRDAMRNVRSLEGRVQPDALTAFLLRHRLLPPLLALGRTTRDPALRETVSEAASLLFLPTLLDERSLAQLAPLASGTRSRDLLERYYRAGTLDEMGKVSLARSAVAEATDDAAFAAGAAPLFLELLCDRDVPARERGAICDVVLGKLLPVEALRPAALDLLAVAFGDPPRTAEQWTEERAVRGGALPLPAGERTFRFLSIVLLKEREEAPPVVARVVRADLRHYEPLFADDGKGGRRFVGALVPDARGEHADFLAPPPGLATGRDIRLLRRPLELERIAVRSFGARGEEIEVSVTLPEDASEPVPAAGAGLGHVVALLDARLRITTDDEERCELVRLLATIDTDASRAAAARHAKGSAVAELIPLAERGDVPFARTVLERLQDLAPADLERALAAIAAKPELRKDLAARCRDLPPPTAVAAAEALLSAGDAAGIEALFGHPDKYARACAAALALRLTPLAGTLRMAPEPPPDPERLAKRAEKAFTKEDGVSFVKLGAWLALALRDPEEARKLRRDHKPLYVGKKEVDAWQFAEAYTEGVREGKAPELWPQLIVFLLDPHDPGAGLAERDLGPLLDALEDRATTRALKRQWIDALIVLACAQHGLEMDAQFAEIADARLEKIAGKDAPPCERRRPGIHWPIWAAEHLK